MAAVVVAMLRRTIVLAALVLATSTCGASGASSAAPAPIVGYWTWNDGVMQIKAVGSGGFEGALVKAESLSCGPKLGHVTVKLTGSGTTYTGQDEWYRLSDCAAKFSTDAKVTVSNGDQTATDCSSGPFTDVAPIHDCKVLTRITNYKPG